MALHDIGEETHSFSLKKALKDHFDIIECQSLEHEAYTDDLFVEDEKDELFDDPEKIEEDLYSE